MKKVERNDPCPCGSGKKFKKCCESKGLRAKFQVQPLTPGALEEKTSKVSNLLFRNVTPRPDFSEEKKENSSNS